MAGGEEGVLRGAKRAKSALVDANRHFAQGLQLGDAAGAAGQKTHRLGPFGGANQIAGLKGFDRPLASGGGNQGAGQEASANGAIAYILEICISIRKIIFCFVE